MTRRGANGFTLVEILMVVAVISLLAAVAIPNILRSRTTANETVAIGNLHTLARSLEMFRSTNNAYPIGATWQTSMYGPDCAAGTQPIPDFGPGSFCLSLTGGGAANTVQGYVYDYAGSATGNTYTLLALPAVAGVTGTRAFFVDQNVMPRHCQSPPAGTVANGPTWNTLDQSSTTPCN